MKNLIKYKKPLIWTGVILAVGTVAYLLYRNYKKTETSSTEPISISNLPKVNAGDVRSRGGEKDERTVISAEDVPQIKPQWNLYNQQQMNQSIQ